MKQFKIVSLFAAGIILVASCAPSVKQTSPQPKGISKAQVDSVSNAIGYSLGMSIKMGNFGDLNMSEVYKGMKDAIEGVELVPQEVNATITDFLDKRNAALAANNVEKGEAFLAKNGKNEGVVTTETGLQYQVVRAGNGVRPSATDTVEVNYEGSTIDGKVFDSSYTRGESVKFCLNQVIPGWSEGLQLIDEGGEITLWIPSGLGYGERGVGEIIAPNENLKFRVELIKVIPAVVVEEAK